MPSRALTSMWCLRCTLQVGLVQADRLYTTKKQIVESVGLSAVQASYQSHIHLQVVTC